MSVVEVERVTGRTPTPDLFNSASRLPKRPRQKRGFGTSVHRFQGNELHKASGERHSTAATTPLPGPGHYNSATGRWAPVIRVNNPTLRSVAFRQTAPRFRHPSTNPNFVPPRLHGREFDAKEWSQRAPSHGFHGADRQFAVSATRGRPTGTQHLFYKPMAHAATDISETLHTTPIRYAAGARTKFTRFPLSQLRPQYTEPIGPGSFETMPPGMPVSHPHDPKRPSSAFASSVARFATPKPRELVGDDWNYSLFDSKIQVSDTVHVHKGVSVGCAIVAQRSGQNSLTDPMVCTAFQKSRHRALFTCQTHYFHQTVAFCGVAPPHLCVVLASVGSV